MIQLPGSDTQKTGKGNATEKGLQLRFLVINYEFKKKQITKIQITYVDLMVMHLSCSSLRVSVNLVSPAREEAMIPAFDTRESVRVDLP